MDDAVDDAVEDAVDGGFTKRYWLWLSLILLVTFGVYARSLRNGYTYDDAVYVRVPGKDGASNEMVAELHPPWRYFRSVYGGGAKAAGRGLRPFTVMSFGVVHWLSAGDGPLPPDTPRAPALLQHLVNILLHCVAVLVCYLVLALFVGGGPPALLGALVFGLHALRSDQVISIIGRAEIQGFVFGGLALWIYVAALRRQHGARWWRLGVVALCLFAAFGSKESAVAWAVFLPLAVVALRWQRQEEAAALPDLVGQVRPILVGIVPPLLLFLGLFAWLRADLAADPRTADFHVAFQNNPLWHAPPLERVASGVMILAYGLYKVFLPIHLAADYGEQVFELVQSAWDYRFLSALVLLASLVAGGCLVARRQPLLFLAMAVFFGFSFLTSNIPLGIETIFGERLYYTPGAALSFLVAWAVVRSRPSMTWKVLAVLLATWLVTCAVLIVQRCGDWESNETLFLKDQNTQSRSVNMQVAAAAVHQHRKDYEGWKHCLERALAIRPDAPVPLNDMAAMYLELGKPSKAQPWIQKALASKHPDTRDKLVELHRMQAMIHVAGHQNALAEKSFQASLRAAPMRHDIRLDFATLYIRRRKPELAKKQLWKIVELEPGFGLAWDRLLRLAERDRNGKEQRRILDEMAQKAPQSPYLFLHQGELALAGRRVEDGVRLLLSAFASIPERPKYFQTWLRLVVALVSLGNRGQAMDVAQQCAGMPGIPEAARRDFQGMLRRLRHGR